MAASVAEDMDDLGYSKRALPEALDGPVKATAMGFSVFFIIFASLFAIVLLAKGYLAAGIVFAILACLGALGAILAGMSLRRIGRTYFKVYEIPVGRYKKVHSEGRQGGKDALRKVATNNMRGEAVFHRVHQMLRRKGYHPRAKRRRALIPSMNLEVNWFRSNVPPKDGTVFVPIRILRRSLLRRIDDSDLVRIAGEVDAHMSDLYGIEDTFEVIG
jgi:hypothetical protein